MNAADQYPHLSDGGQSSRLAARLVAAWREANPDGNVVLRDPTKE